jgi:hypothetical protein
MNLVYTPQASFDVFADWFSDSTFVATDVLTPNIKIACVPMWHAMDYSQFDLVLVSDIEFSHISPVKQWLASTNIKHYLVALGGTERYAATGNYVYRPWWMFNLISKNTFTHTQQDKQLDFDVLLGSKKPHRDFVMAKMQLSKMIDNSLVNYRNVFSAPEYPDDTLTKHVDNCLVEQELFYPYVSPNLKPEWEVRDTISYNVSDIVPWDIYKHTKYSIVAETRYEKVFFLTEKTTKPLFAKRLFIIFSSCGFLQHLRAMGFKTFNNVIDESYDSESNPVKRFEMAFSQVEYLSSLGYNDVLNKITPVLEHNHNRLFEYRQEIKRHMQEMVYNKLEEIKHANSIQ